MTPRRHAGLGIVALAACGAVAVAACGAPEPDELPDLSQASLVLTTAADDYSVGGLAAFAAGWQAPIDAATLHGDAVVTVDGPTTYAINRLGMDTVRRYDALGERPSWEISTGRGSNPHAVARVGDALLITRYEVTALWVVDARSGELLREIDVSSYADSDGLPEPSSAIPMGDRALVALQRLDRPGGWAPDPIGQILVVDPARGQVDAALDVGPNPRLLAHPHGGALVIADDGLWRIDAHGAVRGPVRPDGLDGTIGALGIGPDGGIVVALRPCPTCSEHRIACAPAWDAAADGRSEPIEAYLSSIAITDEGAWIAARRGWSDPERQPGGLIPVDPATCALPPPSAWVHGTLAPFSIVAREPTDR